jgi:aconitate hydratase
MGILPLQFVDADGPDELGLAGAETISIGGISGIEPRGMVTVRAQGADGSTTEFDVRVRLDSPVEMDYYRHGGILPYVLRQLA